MMCAVRDHGKMGNTKCPNLIKLHKEVAMLIIL
jgi:hypothetical protein